MIEFCNAAPDHDFITHVPADIALLDAGTAIRGWARTGRAFRADTTAQPSTSGICRSCIPPGLGDSHFFGRRAAECDATGPNNPSLVLEDPVLMRMFLPNQGVCPAGTRNVYRVFGNRPDANHRNMTAASDRAQMAARGWLGEGDGPDRVVMCAPQ